MMRITLGTITVALAAAVLVAAGDKVPAPALRVVRDKADRPIAVEAVNLPAVELAKLSKDDGPNEHFARLLSVFVGHDAALDELPPMAGSWTVSDSTLRFTPRYPFIAGTRYRARLQATEAPPEAGTRKKSASATPKPIVLEFEVPAEQPGEPNEVIQVYPSAGTLPENNLRFYIHFSQSMGRGEAYQHLSLLNARGKPIDLPFLEIGEELWDPRAKRMTLLIDPGRIKKGVKPREDLGPVLEAGREYTLVVGREWRDAWGRPLKSEFRKRFRAGPPAEAAIDPVLWKIVSPESGSNDLLVIRFPAPLDRALLERTISVSGLDGQVVAGRVGVSDEERRWEFRPLAPWKAGRYQLVIDTALEDLAGNRIGKPFEIDVFSQVDKTAETEPARLPFEIRERS